MSEKRFIVESVMIDCLCEDEPRIAKVITDTDENYSYEDLYEVAELLNTQQATIKQLQKDCKEIIQEKQKLQEMLQVFEHELAVADGLYASDNEEFNDYFRLDFSNLISYPVGEDDEGI